MSRRPLIAIIGDGGPTTEARSDAAEELGRLIVREGWRLLTGGCGGLMEAASRGAASAPNHFDGAVIGLLPGTTRDAGNAHLDIAISTSLGHLRNGLVAAADGVIAIGGGAGTLSEICFAWLHGRPIVALQLGGAAELVAGRSLDDPLNPSADLTHRHVQPASSPEEAMVLLRRALAVDVTSTP